MNDNDSSHVEDVININILRNKINTFEDFIKYIEESKLFDNESDKTYFVRSFSVVKNYLTSSHVSKIFVFPKFNFNQTIYLNFTANSLVTIPLELGLLINLETLILNNNKITKIENLENLVLLKRLELRSNQILKVEN